MLLLLVGCGSSDLPTTTQPGLVQRAREFAVGVDPAVCASRGLAPVRTGIGWTCGAAVLQQAGAGAFAPSVPRGGADPAQVVIEIGQVGPAVQVGPALRGGR